jgi:NADPH-dependent glutamate synthase beta subunit-like oxidoreductase/NAD-dependent dihydropyrimidine dehydrogenase PreA subunit
MNAKAELADKFGQVSMFRTCEQCGSCSSACPITGVRDFNVRRIVRHIELDLIDEIAATPVSWYCTTCGRCETACPNGIAILDIIRPLRAMTPEEFLPEETPPCIRACPAGIDIPGYMRFIAQGKPEEAYKLILEKVPFPGILGRICVHPCETKCRRSEVNQSIAICALKRYAADKANGHFRVAAQVLKSSGRKAAVIGAGPAGLTAAFYLKKKGHEVTVFEGRSKPGGMLRYGIPAYRLPEEVLDKEISQVIGIGIKLETDKKWGRDFTLEQLKSDGFEAVFIAIGLQESRKIELQGSDLEGVLWGVDFLGNVREGKPVLLKERVLVVGGGNVAVDVALTALRTGAKNVTMACLETREQMPASAWEIEQALDEGVKLMPAWGPHRILGDGQKVTGVELVQCTSVFDEKGAFCPAFGEMKETVQADQVILAIGQAADLSAAAGASKLRCERGLIIVDPLNLQTSLPGVFAGGDVSKGPGAVIDAIAVGRKAADAMDRYLGGEGLGIETLTKKIDMVSYDGKRVKGFADLCRSAAPELPVAERLKGFMEVEGCLTDEQAKQEAARCLQCDFEFQMIRQKRESKQEC